MNPTTQANVVDTNASDVDKLIAKTKFKTRVEKTVTLEAPAVEILKGWGIEKGDLRAGLTLALQIADLRCGKEIRGAIGKAKSRGAVEKPEEKGK